MPLPSAPGRSPSPTTSGQSSSPLATSESGGASAVFAPSPGHAVTFREAFLFWLKLGFINFGGPTGQIAVMHQELVDRKRWISDSHFMHALNYCMLLPGPEAQQLAIYVGWLLHRTLGGVVAGVLFVLPGAVFMLGLSWLYVAEGKLFFVQSAFHGLRAAVIAIVAAAIIRLGSRALGNAAMVSIASVAFVGIFFLKVPFPIIVIGAGFLGLFGVRVWPGLFAVSHSLAPAPGSSLPLVRDDTRGAEHAAPTLSRSLRVIATGLVAWWVPLIAVAAIQGRNGILTQEALFFSKAAMITFGGAYAVLAYINQAAVERYGWLLPRQMLDGLGLAETTPGPLILVAQFVGFVGAYNHPGSLSPLAAGILGAAVTCWATFAPCFLWIFLGAPVIERLRGNVLLTGSLSFITAAVVGVILNLAVWLGLHTLFGSVREVMVGGFLVVPLPDPATFDPFAFVLAAVTFMGIGRLKWGILPVVGGSAAVGVAWNLALRALR